MELCWQAVKWLTELVWRYNLFPLDRLVMCMVSHWAGPESGWFTEVCVCRSYEASAVSKWPSV